MATEPSAARVSEVGRKADTAPPRGVGQGQGPRFVQGDTAPDPSNAATALEVKTERDVNLLNDEEFVRVIYRPAGTRRWTRIAVFPDNGQSLEEVEELASEIAEMHRGR